MKNVFIWLNSIGGDVVPYFCNFVAVLSSCHGVINSMHVMNFIIPFIYKQLLFIVCIFLWVLYETLLMNFNFCDGKWQGDAPESVANDGLAGW